jgi:hypothetical protein
MSNDTQATANYTFTPERQREAFEHVADNILMLTAQEIAALTNIGANTILSFINMSTDDLASLQVVDDDGEITISLPISTRNILYHFRYYLHYLDHIGGTPFDEQWFKLTQRDFNDFRQSHWVKYYRGKTLDNIASVDLVQVATGKQASAANGSTTSLTISEIINPVQEFDKGIKRNLTAFPTLKDERYWDRATRSCTRRVYLPDIGDHDVDSGHGESTFDIDTPASTAQQQVEKHLLGPRMPFNIGKNLSPKEQQIWDQFSDATKVAILSGLMSSASRSSSGKGTSSRIPSSRSSSGKGTSSHISSSRFGNDSKGPMPTRPVNLTEISANDSIDMLQDDHADKDDDHTDANDLKGNDEGNTILTHLTQHEQIPPSDICTSLARPKDNDTNDATTPAIQLSTISKKPGTTCKGNTTVISQASMHATTTTYSVSQHESVKMDYSGLVFSIRPLHDV